jgi:Zn-dependent peptidase ImmA (M78 family)
MNSFAIDRLSYKKLGEIADRFLLEFYPSRIPPVPIEEIAESKLNIEIVPIKRLKTDFDVEGCIDSTFKRIFIDFDIYINYENRSRFTIGHEIGHLILHRKIFDSLNISEPKDIFFLSTKLLEEDYRWLEYQAYTFAGHVLVPKGLLEIEIQKRFDLIPKNVPAEILYSLVQDLANIFRVSGDVIFKRMQKEGVFENI